VVGDVVLSVNGYGSGALPADGRILPIAGNTAIFSLVGTNFGGDGTTDFGLPDLRRATKSEDTNLANIGKGSRSVRRPLRFTKAQSSIGYTTFAFDRA
jgi:microcystin-dependent protein